MSAYVVNRKHITYLVSAGLFLAKRHLLQALTWYANGEWHELHYNNRVAVGQMLWDYNIYAVRCRYPDHEELPGPVGEDFRLREEDFPTFNPIEFDRNRTVNLMQIKKACDCYAYQACEAPDWEGSSAKRLIETIQELAISAMPEWEATEWEIETWPSYVIPYRRSREGRVTYGR